MFSLLQSGTRHWQNTEHMCSCQLWLPTGWWPYHRLKIKLVYFKQGNPLQMLQQDLNGHFIHIDPILKTWTLTSHIYILLKGNSSCCTAFFFFIYLRSAETQMGSKLPHAVKNLNLELGDTAAQCYAGSSLNHMMATGQIFSQWSTVFWELKLLWKASLLFNNS